LNDRSCILTPARIPARCRPAGYATPPRPCSAAKKDGERLAVCVDQRWEERIREGDPVLKGCMREEVRGPGPAAYGGSAAAWALAGSLRQEPGHP
jgi:hypothetical protein